MKDLLSSLAVAFSMYSKIPMPPVEWKEKNMRFAIGLFPLVGLVIGALCFLWHLLASALSLQPLFFAAVYTCIPIFVSGGIHADGYLDTCDAMSSWRERARRLEILKDSHAGAFAIIMGIVYFLLYAGGASQIRAEVIPVLGLSFAVSRCFSALSVVSFPFAVPGGTAELFAKNAHKRAVRIAMIAALAVLFAAGIWLHPASGIAMAAAGFLSFVFYYVFSRRNFGGITGDLAGFFVCICELAVLLSVTVTDAVIVRIAG